jgi:NAD(P)H-nitrite reductase large subunit
MKYVIIGNSAAGVGCIEGIRKTDKSGEILLISDEKYATYSRPLISYWLSGKVVDKNMFYRPENFYEKNNVKTMLGVKVTAIDPANKMLTISEGTEVSYDNLLVGTGSRPFVPPIEGVNECKNAVTFLNWESAKQLKDMVNMQSKVIVLGAGLIGLKVAEGLAGHVGTLTVVEMAPQLMPSVLDEAGAAILQKHIEKSGVDFVFGDSAAKAQANQLTLSSGKKLPFDVLVVAAGVRPNVELVRDAGGNVGRGIVTDDKMLTSLDNIYAAGDNVEAVDIVTGTRRIMALLPNAYMQGETAGINMAGGDAEFSKAMPMNAIGFFGMPMVTAGSYDGEEYIEKGEESYKKLVFKGDRLVGYIIINDVDRAGIYTALIREKIDLKGVDIELLKQRPQLMLFGKADRKRILAGGGIAE